MITTIIASTACKPRPDNDTHRWTLVDGKAVCQFCGVGEAGSFTVIEVPQPEVRNR